MYLYLCIWLHMYVIHALYIHLKRHKLRTVQINTPTGPVAAYKFSGAYILKFQHTFKCTI